MTLHNRTLPLWLHRVCNGVLGTAASATLAGFGLEKFPSDHVLYLLSTTLLYLSVPIGVFSAVVTHRFSIIDDIVQEGEPDYDDLLGEHHDDKDKT